MKIAIIGSRTLTNYQLIIDTLEPYKNKITHVVSGGAFGADELGERWAKENGKETLIFFPDWDKYGKKAGYIRNEDIIKNCDGCIAFWDGESKGTQHSMNLCKKFNKPLKIIQFSKEEQPPYVIP